MTAAPEFHSTTFSDLIDVSAASLAPRQWKRGRTWNSGALKYTRPAAIDVAVTMAQHSVLKAALASVGETWDGLRRAVMSRWPEDFLVDADLAKKNAALGEWERMAAPSPYAWPEGLTDRTLAAFRENLRRKGVSEASMEWATADHAAAKALTVFEKQVRAGGAPHAHGPERMSAGVSVRLACGARYGQPIARQGAWLALYGLGAVVCVDPAAVPENVEKAAYVEMAHWDRAWRLRMIFTSERDFAAETPRRGRRAAKANAVAASGAPPPKAVRVTGPAWRMSEAERGRPLHMRDFPNNAKFKPGPFGMPPDIGEWPQALREEYAAFGRFQSGLPEVHNDEGE